MIPWYHGHLWLRTKKRGYKSLFINGVYCNDLITFACLNLPLLFLQLPFKCFSLTVTYRRRFLVVLALLPFTNDTFFFNHSFEPLQSFFKRFSFIYSDLSDRNHLPLRFYVEICCKKHPLSSRRYREKPVMRSGSTQTPPMRNSQ